MPCLPPILCWLCLAACLSWGALEGHAQTAPLRFGRLTAEDGLSNSSITCILQDRQGFMWFGTGNGLNRYDGYSFTVYKHLAEDTATLYDNIINSLYEDRDGRFWVGTDVGLHLYDRDRDRFLRMPLPLENGEPAGRIIKVMLEDRKGNFWIGTEGGGFYGFDRETRSFEAFPMKGKDFWLQRIYALEEDSRGRIWIGTSSGLLRFDAESSVFTPIPNKAPGSGKMIRDFVRMIQEGRRGNLWVGTTGNGLYLFDPERGSFTSCRLPNPARPAIPDVNIFSLLKDETGRMWIGAGNGGVKIWNPELNSLDSCRHAILDPHSLVSDNIRVLYEDKDGGIWIGTRSEGIGYWSPWKKQFVHVIDRNTPNANSVTCFFESAAGEIWIGVLGGGLIRLNRKTRASIRYRHEPGNEHSLRNDLPLSAVEDTNGYVWVVNSKGGVSKFHPGSSSPNFIHYSVPAAFHLFADRGGDIWLGAGAGLKRYDPAGGRFLDCQVEREPGRNTTMTSVRAMHQDAQGKLWAGGMEGLFFYDRDGDRFVRFSRDGKEWTPDQTASPVYAIAGDRQGNLWLGGTAGLMRLEPATGKRAAWRSGDGLPDDMVYGIAEDGRGMIWISTANGLSRFNPATQQFRNYDRFDGLQGDEFNPGAVLKASDGALFFGGINGYTYFYPDSIRDNPNIPPAVLTNFRLLNRPMPIRGTSEDTLEFASPLARHISLAGEIRLRHWQNDVSFEFAALNYLNPEKNRYEYRLEGYDKQDQWIKADASHRWATYTNLAPGKYIFRVKGANGDGVWNEEGTSLSILITPPWYWSWWSKTLYLAAAAILLFLLYRFQLNRRLAAAETHRLRELDQVKTKLYTNITHEFRTPLTVISGTAWQEIERQGKLPPEKNLFNAQMIKRNSDQLLQLVNQMLDLRKLESGTMPLHKVQADLIGYLKYVVESFHSYAESRDIQLEFQTGIGELRMDFDPEKLLSILSNLLSNAVKFTPEGGAVFLRVEREGSFAVLKIRDTGVGIPPEKLPFVFDRFYQADDESTRAAEGMRLRETASAHGAGIGLALTRELVKLLNGEILVASSPGEGSEFTVRLPISREAPAKEVAGRSSIKGKIAPFIPVFGKSLAGGKPSRPASSALPLALIIEDNRDVVHYLVSCLESEYRLEVAHNGQEGIDKALEITPDVIVCDVMMPEKDGFEVCRRLKTDERSSHIPIVLLTARADTASRLEGLEQGADAYLPKPFDKAELLIRLKKLLELRRRLQKHYLSLAAGDNRPGAVPPAVPVEKAEDVFVLKARSIIEAHLDDPSFSVSHLCREAAISNSQFHRKITALTGYSATRFIRFIRLSRARRLLLESDLNISEVAFQAGFNDPVYFTRVFRREFGVTPSGFREKGGKAV